MRTTLVYDLPTRLFHWLFVFFFLSSFVIAKTVDDESILFSYHMISGLLLGGLIVWRVFWGLIGTRHARWSGFKLNPLELKEYFLGLLSGSKKRWSGHNPASSWAAVVMMVLGFALAVSGYLMSIGYKESLEDSHELLANAFIVVAILHVAGVIFHSLRHQEALPLSMIDGKKDLFEKNEAIPSTRPGAAFVFIMMLFLSTMYLVSRFDSQERTLSLFGQTLELGD